MDIILCVLLLNGVFVNAKVTSNTKPLIDYYGLFEKSTTKNLMQASRAEIEKLVRFFLASHDLTTDDIYTLGRILTQKKERKPTILLEAEVWAKQHNVTQWFDVITADLRKYWQMQEMVINALIEGVNTFKKRYESVISKMQPTGIHEKPKFEHLIDMRLANERAFREFLRKKQFERLKKKADEIARFHHMAKHIWKGKHQETKNVKALRKIFSDEDFYRIKEKTSVLEKLYRYYRRHHRIGKSTLSKARVPKKRRADAAAKRAKK